MAGDSASAMLDDALKKAGETSTSPERATALKYLNRAQLDVLSGSNEFDVDAGEVFPWSLASIQRSLILKPAFGEGTTVSLTNGSTSGTLSDPPAYSLVGRQLKINDRPEFFIITAHTAGMAAITLEVEYSDDTGAALSFSAKKLRYDLGDDILRLVSPMGIYRPQGVWDDEDSKIFGIDFSTFKKSYPLTMLRTGSPTRFAEIEQTDGAATKLEVIFDKIVFEETKVDYDYVPYPTAMTDSVSSYSVMPRNDNMILVYITAFWLAMDKEDTDKIAQFAQLSKAKLKAMIEARNKKMQKTSKNRGKLLARQEEVAHTNRYRRFRHGW